MTNHVQTFIDFCPAEPRDAEALSFNYMNWTFPGTALTTSLRTIEAQTGLAAVRYANLTVEWKPTNADAKIKCVSADEGPTNIQNLGPWVQASDLTPDRINLPNIKVIDMTAPMQSVVAAGVQKQVGFQVSGAGIIYRLTLVIEWNIDLSSILSRLDALEAAIAAPAAPASQPTTQTIAVPVGGTTITFVQETA